jgi:hypothetical protein
MVCSYEDIIHGCQHYYTSTVYRATVLDTVGNLNCALSNLTECIIIH